MDRLHARKKRGALDGSLGSFDVPKNNQGKRSMMDILLIGIGVLFFVLCIAYTKACDSL
jgi:hypothetical protein